MPHRSAARRMTWLAFTLLLAVQWTANSRAQPEPTPASPASAPTTQPPEPAKAAPTLDPAWISAFKWRSIGPANMGGRIADLAVNEKDPSTYWVATASGGLLKTTNNGHTWEHQFDRQATVSIGDVTVAPSNPDIVWVGTGEANPRNSVSWGDGVYKSVDGGKSWARMGLEKTFQIGRILVHPTNPDIVYVAAMGRCWGENEERGFYRTADGGKSWERILYVDAKTGAIDAAMMPGNPDTILVAMWERQRDIYDSNDPAKKWGPGSGLYRTTDGGKTFGKITAGLAEGQVGRIGLDFWRKDPSHAYLVMESEYAGLGNPNAAYLGLTGENAEAGARITRVVENGPAGTAGLKVGEIIVGADGAPVASYDALLALVRKKQPGDTLRLQVVRETKGVDVELTVGKRPLDLNARPFSTRLGGQVPNVQDEQGPEGARTGGVYKSVDGGATWTRINSLTPRPMYFSKIRVDPSDENWIWVLGISLHVSSDNGKTFRDDGGRGVHADHHAMWIDPANGSHIILGCDGGLYSTYDRGKNWDHHNDTAIGQFYHVALDSRPVYNVYGGLQDNGSWGGPSRSRLGGAINEDWFRIGGGDGFICAVDPNDPDQLYYESQNGGSGWRNLRTGRSGSLRPQPPRGVQYRFNWKTPFVLSAHNPGIYYSAGNYVFRALSATATIKAISPALGRTERGTATALTESPLDSDVLYVGTDDGMMWTTRDGGKTWFDLLKDVPEHGSPDSIRGPGQAGARGAGGGARPGRVPDEETETPDEPAPGAPAAVPPPAAGGEARPAQPPAARPARPAQREGATSAPSDPVAGTWKARIKAEGGGEGTFDLIVERNREGRVGGRVTSDAFTGPVTSGSFDAATGELKITIEGPTGAVRLEGKVEGESMTGSAQSEDGRLSLTFEARREPARTGRGQGGGRAGTEALPPGKPLGAFIARPLTVSTLEASRFAPGRVYAALDAHRSDDDAPYLIASEDYGRTWRDLRGDLPASAGSARALREDLRRADVLYLGTEFGCWVSVNRGRNWVRLNSNLPTVAVHDFAQHPTMGEMVAATHGRSLWILDVSPIRQLTAEALAAPFTLYKPSNVMILRPAPANGSSGVRVFRGQNPAGNATIHYSLTAAAKEGSLKITEPDGTLVRELKLPSMEPGMHTVTWDLRRAPARGQQAGARAAIGAYRAVLTIDGKEQGQTFSISGDPDFPSVNPIAELEEYERSESERRQRDMQFFDTK